MSGWRHKPARCLDSTDVVALRGKKLVLWGALGLKSRSGDPGPFLPTPPRPPFPFLAGWGVQAWVRTGLRFEVWGPWDLSIREEGRGRKLYRPSVSDWGWKGNCWGSVKEVPSGSASFVPDPSSLLKFNVEESLYDRLHRVVKYLLVV